jgi:hypothetical protein
MNEPDPFTGAWTFQPAKSTMNAPGVQRWVQCIEVKDGTIRVREDVFSSGGVRQDEYVNAIPMIKDLATVQDK